MANSADPDQLASVKPADLDLHCLQRQGTSRFSRTRVKMTFPLQIFSQSDYLIQIFLYKFTYFMTNSADPDLYFRSTLKILHLTDWTTVYMHGVWVRYCS